MAETSCNQLLIDSATSLLTIYSPILNNIAMSLYDIISLHPIRTLLHDDTLADNTNLNPHWVSIGDHHSAAHLIFGNLITSNFAG